ncbi:hypothetical protein [Pelagibius marinus]|uniref:hypothetical protein n=1 Tax=Pelagibius marinus TaxID=2762760 RepID=UPI001D03952D|nr:hypothetical protein [Pelagibius marinus]
MFTTQRRGVLRLFGLTAGHTAAALSLGLPAGARAESVQIGGAVSKTGPNAAGAGTSPPCPAASSRWSPSAGR